MRYRPLSWLLTTMACATASCTMSFEPDAGRDDAGALHACSEEADDCRGGLFFQTCSGDEGPVFACHETQGQCGWFRGGCQVGYRTSNCPADNRCCYTTEDGMWPFDGWAPADSWAKQVLRFDVAAIGWATVDATSPSNILVQEDASVGPPAPGVDRIRCSEGASLQVCEGVSADVVVPRAHEDTVVARFTAGRLFGEEVLLEIVPAEPLPRARLFVREYSDAAPSSVPSACLPFHREVLSGSLRLNTLDLSAPELLHGVLEASLVEDESMVIEF